MTTQQIMCAALDLATTAFYALFVVLFVTLIGVVIALAFKALREMSK